MRNDGGFLLWWDGLRSEMQPIHDSQGVFAVLEKEVRRLGFDYYAYGVRHTIPFTRPKTEVHGTYPKAWLERYQMQNYGAVDPAILNGLRSSEMVVWSDSLFDQSRMLWNEARDWGLCVGATLPIRAPNNLLSVLSVARDQQNISSFGAGPHLKRRARRPARPTRSGRLPAVHPPLVFPLMCVLVCPPTERAQEYQGRDAAFFFSAGTTRGLGHDRIAL